MVFLFIQVALAIRGGITGDVWVAIGNGLLALMFCYGQLSIMAARRQQMQQMGDAIKGMDSLSDRHGLPKDWWHETFDKHGLPKE